ncbi:hypothetical protein K502DRAFT_325729 [Neoconidiobolus thromboides FSU 785]|nr:hypothetical protein K502DRAFT_325729 [Neoconidiobolus thromboides FSU 785]
MSIVSSNPTFISSIPEEGLLKMDTQENNNSNIPSANNSKYGDMKKFNTGTRKVNTYPSSLTPRSRRCSENWDGDFELEPRASLKIPTSVRSSSDLANKDSSNFRNLSEKKIVLRDLLRRVHLKMKTEPEKAFDEVGQAYSQDLQEADALVQHLHEEKEKGLAPDSGDASSAMELKKKQRHKILEQNEVFKTLLSRTRPPSPVTPDGCSLASDSSSSQEGDNGFFHFTPDVLPPLLDKMDILIQRLTEYLDYLEW